MKVLIEGNLHLHKCTQKAFSSGTVKKGEILQSQDEFNQD